MSLLLAPAGILVNAATAYEQALPSPLKPSWPPEGQKITCPVTRDTWISSVGDEKIGSNGGETGLRLKGNRSIAFLISIRYY